MLKLLILADIENHHTKKWAVPIANSGINVRLVGFGKRIPDIYNNSNIVVSLFNPKWDYTKSVKGGSLAKLICCMCVFELRAIINSYKPNLIHVHSAATYGMIGLLCGFNPYIVSLWGSDVYIMPKRSFLHLNFLKLNLLRASKIFSTSTAMAREATKYTKKPIYITPFGVDIQQFRPLKKNNIFNKKDIIIGTTKSLEKVYGIDYLIEAFSILNRRYDNYQLKLLIVGDGSEKGNLQNLVASKGLQDNVIFIPKVSPDKMPQICNMIDIFVVLSNSESFGVSILEASACGIPIVATKIGGIPEVVKDGITGFLIPPADPSAAANAIAKLIIDINLRSQMGRVGREFVKRNYNFQYNLDNMISLYKQIAARNGC